MKVFKAKAEIVTTLSNAEPGCLAKEKEKGKACNLWQRVQQNPVNRH